MPGRFYTCTFTVMTMLSILPASVSIHWICIRPVIVTVRPQEETVLNDIPEPDRPDIRPRQEAVVRTPISVLSYLANSSKSPKAP